MKLSIIVPLYNEKDTVRELLQKVIDATVSLEKEIIVVNDGSTDGSEKIVSEFVQVKLINKDNGGKGSAVKVGFEHASGDICIVQDADLEYDPRDYQACIDPILKGDADVVYGSRLLHPDNKEISSLAFYLGGRLVTFFTNFLFWSRLTDEPTCYKTFRTETIRKFSISGNGFEWEPEITAKLLKSKIKIAEVPIRYYPRKKTEGKKIKWRDGVIALLTLLKYRFK